MSEEQSKYDIGPEKVKYIVSAFAEEHSYAFGDVNYYAASFEDIESARNHAKDIALQHNYKFYISKVMEYALSEKISHIIKIDEKEGGEGPMS